MNESNTKRVVVRVKSELYREYQIYLVKKDITMKEDITSHIKKQVENYIPPEPAVNEKEYSNLEYTKANFLIDKDLYSEYKIILIKEKTTPTADIIRYMMYVV